VGSQYGTYQNLKVAPRFLENMCTPDVGQYLYSTTHLHGMVLKYTKWQPNPYLCIKKQWLEKITSDRIEHERSKSLACNDQLISKSTGMIFHSYIHMAKHFPPNIQDNRPASHPTRLQSSMCINPNLPYTILIPLWDGDWVSEHMIALVKNLFPWIWQHFGCEWECHALFPW